MKCPKCGVELGHLIDEETGDPVFDFCPKCGADLSEVREDNLQECCIEILGWIKYRDWPEVVNSHPLKVVMESGDLYYCCSCGKVLGSCSFCGNDYGMPLMLFLDKGTKGMIIICEDCWNLLGLKPVLT